MNTFSVARRLTADQFEPHSTDNWQPITLTVAEEVPIALVYNGISHVVLMATPQDLRELAYGFSLSEGIIDRASQIYAVDVVASPDGMLVHMELATACFMRLKQQRRQLVGRSGCGLCGVESLAALAPQILPISDAVKQAVPIEPMQISQAFIQMAAQQVLNQQTGALHAAALLYIDAAQQKQLRVFEDVGRHNALDKLLGWRVLQAKAPLGVVLLTSRLSYELVQKTARAGLPVLAAISAPTGLAIRLAQQANMTLLGFVRDGRMTRYVG
ncbi:MAG: formate dehydrogenase accessory sulfurtransferase FdhD [Pseudomonadota bacterium]|nr:formate dehydrogenase accessory sulfurtransferase FdhD [Pseudomonadota bacterium]